MICQRPPQSNTAKKKTNVKNVISGTTVDPRTSIYCRMMHCGNSQTESETRDEFLVIKAAILTYFYPPSPIGSQGDGSVSGAPP